MAPIWLRANCTPDLSLALVSTSGSCAASRRPGAARPRGAPLPSLRPGRRVVAPRGVLTISETPLSTVLPAACYTTSVEWRWARLRLARRSATRVGFQSPVTDVALAVAFALMLVSLYLTSFGSAEDPAADPAGGSLSADVPTWFWIVLLVLVGALAFGAIWYGVRSYRWRQEEYKAVKAERMREAEVFESAVDRLREKMALPNLIELNRLMLDNYHGIATEQAEVLIQIEQKSDVVWLRLALSMFFGCVIHPSTYGSSDPRRGACRDRRRAIWVS